MKWRKFLWSALLIAVLIAWPTLLTRLRSFPPTKFGFFPLILVAWFAITLSSAILFMLRLIKRQYHPHSFLNIFLAQANILLVVYGFSRVLAPNSQQDMFIEILILIGNMALGLIFGFDYLSAQP